jgi:hypothetical protein
MSVQILDVVPSHRKDKKFKAVISDGREIHFGLKGSVTYIDGASSDKRNAYLKRHLANKTENNLISNLIMSPSLLSAYILWNTNDIAKNINILNTMLEKTK